MSQYHTPVMASECIDLLRLQSDKIYVDATLGGGGHALAMLQANPKIRLIGFDQDAEAITEAQKTLSGYDVTMIKSNFRQLRTMLAYKKIKGIDGILFDLGISSHQIDSAGRGFSFDKKADLDMRMDTDIPKSAFDIVNELSAGALGKIFFEYGEELASGKIARAIEKYRLEAKISTTNELSKIIESVTGTGSKESLKSKVRIFQALRIAVNDELNALSAALHDSINILNPGGRIVVMSYHSLEDRIVKNIFKIASKSCLCPSNIMNCVCGHKKQLKILTNRPVTATDGELEQNNRARSAKLRAAEKVMGEK